MSLNISNISEKLKQEKISNNKEKVKLNLDEISKLKFISKTLLQLIKDFAFSSSQDIEVSSYLFSPFESSHFKYSSKILR